MHAHFLDPFKPGQSLIHRLDSRIKLALILSFILTVALTPIGIWPVYILLLALAMALEILSELGLGFYLKRALLALPFVLAALPVIFTTPGESLLELPLGLVVTAPGLARMVSISLKSWISVQMAILLASTTSFPDLLLALRALRLPRLLVAVIGLMWRYLFVMVDEAMRLTRAREARSSTHEVAGYRSGGKLTWRARVTGSMAGSLFLRSLERSDRIYMAMLARGYDGEIRSLPQPAIPLLEWFILGFSLLLLGSLLVISYLV